ncbi:acyl carrier protein [Herbaspirillum sp. RTI4]|uniref:acyl carrier protein n=1 Tax=Herbaspirillum sp. RTI4 TaxID=3048640 RepID=UPI002B22DA6D|nr:acyl carrier protein [Herbaspirillum sp. RTI4]MEA9983314.1 acyl carrier protein [Herbaspirillum sp. RTI4]
MQCFRQAMGALWSLGYGIDPARIWRTPAGARQAPLPAYQFEQMVCWLPLPQRVVAAPTASATASPQAQPAVSDAAWASAAEGRVAQAFHDILGNTGMDVSESFFDAGGNSLSALRLASMLNTAFKMELPLAVLY